GQTLRELVRRHARPRTDEHVGDRWAAARLEVPGGDEGDRVRDAGATPRHARDPERVVEHLHRVADPEAEAVGGQLLDDDLARARRAPGDEALRTAATGG